jgi:hypothetical protein
MKYVHAYALFLMFVFGTSCGGQNKTDLTKENSKSESKDILTFVHTKYEYTDSIGKRLIIQNSYPRGIKYTDPNGKEYSKFIFWTRIINETDNPLELKIDFPVYSYEVPSLPGKYFKVLVLPDTMTVDKEPLHDYGITDLKSFLDNNIHKPSSLKRTTNPKESDGFFVAILFDKGVFGPIRTGLNIKGQNLFYKVTRYESKPGGALVDEKEINCGSINLKNLVLRK